MKVVPRFDLALDVDVAVVALHDRVHDREAEAGALAGRLGREERVEDVVQVLRRNADAGVAELELDAAVEQRRGAHAQLAAVRHRLHRRW